LTPAHVTWKLSPQLTCVAEPKLKINLSSYLFYYPAIYRPAIKLFFPDTFLGYPNQVLVYLL
jgi:hypothetical protein